MREGPRLGSKKGLKACLGPGTCHTLKLRDLRWVPGISLQPLREDLIQLSGPGKGRKGNSHVSRPAHLTRKQR